ncbi:hypothetical protein [Oleiharenicola sp. Vm1]|uniref:hypothetical protein n=1 Tax=Oleiharenicola sp. Vm1 TaxID=3398393 RepID=UPI0039F50C0D
MFSDVAHSSATAAWVQALIYLITLVVLWRQLYLLQRQLRAQDKSARDAEYLKAQTDFTESLRLLIRAGTHEAVYDSLQKDGQSRFVRWGTYSPAEKKVYAYFELLYELFERVFVMWKDGWISEHEWEYWRPWIADVIRHPLLHDVHEDNRGMFDSRFEAYLDTKLPKKEPNKASEPTTTSVTSPAAQEPHQP